MRIHPATKLFPLMGGPEFEALMEDIRKHGQQEPIYEYEGKILDGRNRLKACAQLGIEPWIETWEGATQDPFALVMSMNYHRRHLSSVESGQVLASYLKLKGGKKRTHGGDRRSGKARSTATVAVVAKELGIAERTARQHLNAAEDYDAAVPELQKKVDAGEITPKQARKVSEKLERDTASKKPIPKKALALKLQQEAERDKEAKFHRWWASTLREFEFWTPYYRKKNWGAAWYGSMRIGINTIRKHLKEMEAKSR